MPKHPILKQPTYPYKAWVIYGRDERPVVHEVDITSAIGDFVWYYRKAGDTTLHGRIGKDDAYPSKQSALARAIKFQEKNAESAAAWLHRANGHLAALKAEMEEVDHE